MSSFSFDDELDHHDLRADLDDDADTASQRSIPLSSPPASRPISTLSGDSYEGLSSEADAYDGIAPAHSHAEPELDTYDTRGSRPSTLSTEGEAASLFGRTARESTSTSPTPSLEAKEPPAAPVTYPPPPQHRASVASFATDVSVASSSRKARPESVLLDTSSGPIVLGIALVDFNHQVRAAVRDGAHVCLYLAGQVGPRIEYSRGDVFADEEIGKILPFLALPDGAHLVRSLLLPSLSFSNTQTERGRLLVLPPRARLAEPDNDFWHFVQPADRNKRSAGQGPGHDALDGTEGGRCACVQADIWADKVCGQFACARSHSPLTTGEKRSAGGDHERAVRAAVRACCRRCARALD
jgi:hypothetical protein